MILALLISTGVLGLAFLGLAFLLLGTLRSLGVLSWRLEQLEATSPRRLGRDGLKVGKKAPDFALPDSQNGERSLHDFAGRKVLLIFTQSGCGPCHAIMPELKRLQAKGEVTVLVVNNGTLDETRKWAGVESDSLPILVQEKFSVSKRYQVFATPFAFLLNDQGIITSKGLAGSREHLGYVLRGLARRTRHIAKSQKWTGLNLGRATNPFFQRRFLMFERIGQVAEEVVTRVSRRQFLSRFSKTAAVAASLAALFGVPSSAHGRACTTASDCGAGRHLCCGGECVGHDDRHCSDCTNVCPPGTHCHRVRQPLGGDYVWTCV